MHQPTHLNDSFDFVVNVVADKMAQKDDFHFYFSTLTFLLTNSNEAKNNMIECYYFKTSNQNVIIQLGKHSTVKTVVAELDDNQIKRLTG